MHTGDPLGPVGTGVLAMDLLLNAAPILGSYVWTADPTTDFEGTVHLPMENELFITTTILSTLQIRNRSSGAGSGVSAAVSTFITGNNPVRTSITITKLG